MNTELQTAITNAANTITKLADDVDRLGELKAQAKVLKDQIDAIESELKASGIPAIDGAKYRATVSVADRDTVAWKAIAQKLEPSRQLVTAYTKTSEVTTLRVVAHTK